MNARDQNKLSFLGGAKNPRTLRPAAPSNPFSLVLMESRAFGWSSASALHNRLSPYTGGIKRFWAEQRFSAA